VSARSWLFILNVLVLVGLAVYAFTTLRKQPEAKQPENLTPFLPDEDLEGRRLERVLGWALLFAAVVAVALPLYWLHEPSRQRESKNYFNNGSVKRGETLFANAASPGYNAAVSLQCANCHGSKGEGGVVATTYDPDGDGPVKPMQVTWKAPPLNTELLRFSRSEVRQIITYGRPGTPMQPWGVAGGGPKNTQAVDDLINFINSIQLTPAQAQAEAQKALDVAKTAAADLVTTAQGNLTKALAAEKAAQKTLADTLADPKATNAQKAAAQAAVTEAPKLVADARNALAWAKAWEKSRANVTDGQLLFEINCARCHTKGWSVFDPLLVNGTGVLGPAGGGGQGGAPNLRANDEIRRFGPGDTKSLNFKANAAFVGLGSENEKPYGIGGIGSGKMPGFSSMLTQDMINQIVAYERDGIDATTYDVPFNGSPGAANSTGTGTVSTTTTLPPKIGG
jgi:mono/diheme cytochrome c family protein